MAKILYGVSGEGSGHASRAGEIASFLEKSGHEVKIVSYGRGFINLKPDFDVMEIFGLRFSIKENKITYSKTIFENLLNTPEALKSISAINSLVKLFKPDIVITDFEPLSALIACLKKLPLISIDNQHRFTNTDIKIPPRGKKDFAIAKIVINSMVSRADAYLITSFAKDRPVVKNSFVFPPILRKEIRIAKTRKGKYILIYVSSPYKDILDILKTIDKDFIVYGFNKNMKIKNLILKKSSQKGFIRDLAGADAVIANAGFTLIAEALYHHKPYLAIPISRQFEQAANAYNLEHAGYGQMCYEISREKVEDFLSSLDVYRNNLKKYNRTDNSLIFAKINELIDSYSK